MLVRFAFASLSFLCYFFASTTIISYVYYDLNFLIYFLLRIEDRVKVGAIKVVIVAGT
jgi:Na+/alanine symporter